MKKLYALVATTLMALAMLTGASAPASADDTVYNPRDPQCSTGGSNSFQVVYAYNASDGNDLTSKQVAIRTAIKQANGLLYDQSGGAREFRVITNANCVIQITPIAVPESELLSGAFLPTVYNNGMLQSHFRMFVVFRDDPHQTTGYTGCGIAGHKWGGSSGPTSVLDHPYKDKDNPSNAGPAYAELMAPDVAHPDCWTGKVVAHEMFHNLGSVMLDAPHSDGASHATDLYDIMGVTLGGTLECDGPWPQADVTIDCNGDDYFNLTPWAGPQPNFLNTYWNTADSSFLIGGGPAASTTGLPAQVANLSVSWVGCHRAVVNWTHVTTNAGYRVRLFRDRTGTDTLEVENKALAPSVTLENTDSADLGKKHYVTIQAVNSYGLSTKQTVTNPDPACTL